MKVTQVSQKEMKRRTGFGRALGYALPKKGEVLVRDDLTPKKRKEVLAHEEEHMARGEEGPFLDFVADIVGAGIQGESAGDAAKEQRKGAAESIAFQEESRDMARADQAPYRIAGNTALSALMDMVGLPRSQEFNDSRQGYQPEPTNIPSSVPAKKLRYFQKKFGQDLSGANPLQRQRMERKFGITMSPRAMGGPTVEGDYYMVNEMGPEDRFEDGAVYRNDRPMAMQPSGDGYVKPHGRAIGGPMYGGVMGRVARRPQGQSQPQAQQQPVDDTFDWQTSPGYQFRQDEGMRALERSAAARGGLLSGGFARKAIRYGQDYATNEYSNVYNRIANIAGLGQTSATTSGNASMMAGANMGTSAMDAGYARGYGVLGRGNAIAGAVSSAGDFAQGWWDNRGKGISNNAPEPTFLPVDPYRS